MTAKEFLKDKLPKTDDFWEGENSYLDLTGLEALLEKYHRAKLKLLGITIVGGSVFTSDDMKKAYQAGGIETYNEGLKPETFESLRVLENNASDWYERYSK